MSKYYRVRNQREWDWLMKWFEEQGTQWSDGEYPTEVNKWNDYKHKTTVELNKNNKLTYCDYQFYVDMDNPDASDFIEVSQMMEDENVEEPMTEIILDDLNQVNHGVRFEDGKKIRFIDVPTRLIYPKVKFTKDEKAEFDSIDNDETLYNALDIIEREDYPHLYKRIYEHAIMSIPKFELEFARAWADPSLIEVIPEDKYWVKCYPTDDCYFYKYDGKILAGVPRVHLERFHFTAKEITDYHLDGNTFEKAEASE